MPYVNVAGRRMAYDREGAGRPVLLVHGAAQDSTSWRELSPRLVAHADVVALDLPGHGKSALDRHGPVESVEGYARAVHGFGRALGLDRPVLVGHSLGGATCLRVAVEWPDDVAAVVNLDGSATSTVDSVGYPDGLLDLVAVNPTDWMDCNFHALLGRSLSRRRRWELAFDARRVAPEVVLGDLRAYTSCDFLDRLVEIRVPVLSVVGEDDWSCTPERVRRNHDALDVPKDYVVLPGVGHLPQLEAADRVAELVHAFLQAHLGQPSHGVGGRSCT